MALLSGAGLLLHVVLKMLSARYFSAVYEKPLTGKLTESERRKQQRDYGWRRYVLTINEVFIGIVLVTWALGLLNLSL